MLPFCERHQTYHYSLDECSRMDVERRRLDRMVAQRKQAERIAQEQLRAYNERMGRTLRQDVKGDGVSRAIQEMLIDAVLAGLERTVR